MSAPSVGWALKYILQYGLALVPIPPGHKAPLQPGWNRSGGYITDPSEARQRWIDLPDHGIGVVLSPSGLCSLDVDSPDHALPVLCELGIAFGALREVRQPSKGTPPAFA